MKVYSPFEFFWQQTLRHLPENSATQLWENTDSPIKDSWGLYYSAYVDCGRPDVPLLIDDLKEVNSRYFILEYERKLKKEAEKQKRRILNV